VSVTVHKRRQVTCVDCGETRVLTYGLRSSLLPKRCLSCARKRQRERLLSGEWLDCPNCGTRFWRKRSYLANRKSGRQLFCSLTCLKDGGGYAEMAREQSIARRGKGNPAYKHGRKVNTHIPGWNLKQKGETSCRNCGSHERVQLHHVIPRSHSRVAKTDLRNGIPLCGDCHFGWHSRRVAIYRDIFTTEEWQYLLSIDLIDWRTSAWLDLNYPVRPARTAASRSSRAKAASSPAGSTGSFQPTARRSPFPSRTRWRGALAGLLVRSPSRWAWRFGI
jgi:hypothetical protein